MRIIALQAAAPPMSRVRHAPNARNVGLAQDAGAAHLRRTTTATSLDFLI